MNQDILRAESRWQVGSYSWFTMPREPEPAYYLKTNVHTALLCSPGGRTQHQQGSWKLPWEGCCLPLLPAVFTGNMSVHSDVAKLIPPVHPRMLTAASSFSHSCRLPPPVKHPVESPLLVWPSQICSVRSCELRPTRRTVLKIRNKAQLAAAPTGK